MRNRALLGATALSILVTPVTPALAQSNPKPGSAYVQCDGQPDNWTDGETAARLIGAVTLLGLFAPPHEAPDASKRKFGAEGVTACTSLLSGEHQESNAKRRLGLILGRAVHQIEAKNYPAAVADAQMARHEAEAAGLMADPYFARSRGRSFDLVESAALIRMGRAEDARSASMRQFATDQYAFVQLINTPTYDDFIRTSSPDEERLGDWRDRLAPVLTLANADRLQMNGKFAEAARVLDALIDFTDASSPETKSSSLLAQAAIAHALAGDYGAASNLAKAARENTEKRRLEGKPDTNASNVVELLDLYTILDTAHAGDVKGARRLFAARSEWVSASLGSIMEVNRQLRQGASPDELIGGLAHSPDDLWKEHVETARAALLAKDSDNKTLFQLLPGERSAKIYQALSKSVWRTDKSKIILPRKADSKTPMDIMYLPMVDPVAAMDGYVLHAALVSKARGKQGFVFLPILTGKIMGAAFLSGNRGDKGLPPELFLDANDVIAKLSPLIPQPTS
jgi:hypothetical protein